MLPWLNDAASKRIAIIGDLILDEYCDGTVNRVSPEAPVPVLHVKQVFHTAGGAANAARNVASAGGKAFLFGMCGKDSSGDTLKAL